ncbi:hypothetical protein [Synechococcus sp. ATX 2A4]|uniref:hypothetical protein n=1 Tax=Synechococcus sp. ATX 2A4 TaxID=2823727 RepID=UPI0020CE288B|nr:hypothetical protein [Synechococcus sp. ATX 2A4]
MATSAQLLKTRLVFHLLRVQARDEKQAGSTLVAGILVVLALLVGSLGLVAVVTGSNLASFGSGESRDAQQVAEAGADQIIATFNQPENRQLLVAGSTPPNQWSTTNAALQSPCVSTSNVRPGGTGFPSTRAIGLANGQFRNLENITQVNQGNRRFALQSIRYSAGTPGSTDRRGVFRTFNANGTALSQGGVIPAGTTFNSLLNLDDPDGGGPLRPGTNTGYIAVTVEGRLYRADGTFSTSTITKEFEVVPKCCGGSFGSNDSGGSAQGAAAAGDLGADSRFCGIEFGMITGINGGRFLSQAANDRYTKRNEANQVVNIASILGIIDNADYVWDRNTQQVVGGRQVGCRTVPSPCNTTAEIVPGDTSGNTIGGTGFGSYFRPFLASQNPTPALCPPASGAPLRLFLGNEASIQGRAASCIPIVPLFLSTGLPSIASKYTYAWTVGGNPDTVSKQTVTSANTGGYPVFDVQAADRNGPNADGVNIWLRGNGATSVDQVTPGPFLEYCNTRYLPDNACASVFDGKGSTIHTWAVVSRPGAVTGGIGDDFASNSLSGFTANSTPRWPSIWQENDRGNTKGSELTTGDVTIAGGNAEFRKVANTAWNADFTNAPALARAVNLYALQTPVLEFTLQRSGRGAFTGRSALRVDYSFDAGAGVSTDEAIGTDAGWVQMATITANGVLDDSNGASGPDCTRNPGTGAAEPGSSRFYTCRIAFPPAAFATSNRFSHYVKFRIRANDQYSTVARNTRNRIQRVLLDNVAIRSSPANPSAPPQYLNWCEYSPNFPATVSFDGGFHCLGPTVDMRGLGNNLWMDTTDHSITFYYNRPTDSRGITTAQPLINLFQGGAMANVSCTRGVGNPVLGTAPIENCKTLVAENVFNPVGEYDRFNIFGRDTTPANNCFDAGLANQPCNQVVIIGADSSATAANRSRIAGAWFYMPWGLVSFCVNGCGPLPAITEAELAQDDSWNFGGRIWVRTILAGGQNHFRVPPSSSSSLTQLVGATNSADVTYIGWEGIDWVARSPSAARRGSLD